MVRKGEEELDNSSDSELQRHNFFGKCNRFRNGYPTVTKNVAQLPRRFFLCAFLSWGADLLFSNDAVRVRFDPLVLSQFPKILVKVACDDDVLLVCVGSERIATCSFGCRREWWAPCCTGKILCT